MLVENPPEKVSWKSESQFIVESASDFFFAPHTIGYLEGGQSLFYS